LQKRNELYDEALTHAVSYVTLLPTAKMEVKARVVEDENPAGLEISLAPLNFKLTQDSALFQRLNKVRRSAGDRKASLAGLTERRQINLVGRESNDRKIVSIACNARHPGSRHPCGIWQNFSVDAGWKPALPGSTSPRL